MDLDFTASDHHFTDNSSNKYGHTHFHVEKEPGHGGFMDRCDCQFIMGTAAFVVFSTFIEKPLVMMPLDRIISAAQTLTPEEQQALLDAVQGMVGGATGAP